MGMDQILEDLLAKKDHTIEFRKDAHNTFFQRYIPMHEGLFKE
jgi:hypothetical protein